MAGGLTTCPFARKPLLTSKKTPLSFLVASGRLGAPCVTRVSRPSIRLVPAISDPLRRFSSHGEQLVVRSLTQHPSTVWMPWVRVMSWAAVTVGIDMPVCALTSPVNVPSVEQVSVTSPEAR